MAVPVLIHESNERGKEKYLFAKRVVLLFEFLNYINTFSDRFCDMKNKKGGIFL